MHYFFCLLYAEWRRWRLLFLAWIRPAKYLYRQDSLVRGSSLLPPLHSTKLSWAQEVSPYLQHSWGALTMSSLTQLLWSLLCCIAPTKCSCSVLESSTYRAQTTAPKALSPSPSLGTLLTDRAEPLTTEPTPPAKSCTFPTAPPSCYTWTLHQSPIVSPPWLPHLQFISPFLWLFPS